MQLTILNRRVEKELLALGSDAQAALDRTIELMHRHGTYALGLPHVRKLHGTTLWQIRLKDKKGIARVVFVALAVEEIIVLHAFRKKTEKMPKQAIDLALQRLKEM